MRRLCKFTDRYGFHKILEQYEPLSKKVYIPVYTKIKIESLPNLIMYANPDYQTFELYNYDEFSDKMPEYIEIT